MDKNYLGTHISLKLPKGVNAALTQAAARSGRRKVSEAMIRLEDHLNNFADIASEGRRFKPDGEKG